MFCFVFWFDFFLVSSVSVEKDQATVQNRILTNQFDIYFQSKRALGMPKEFSLSNYFLSARFFHLFIWF